MKIIESRNENFEINGNKLSLYSYEPYDNPGQVRVRLFIGDQEIATQASTRGEAMLELADFLRSVGAKLCTMALEQEGTFRDSGRLRVLEDKRVPKTTYPQDCCQRCGMLETGGHYGCRCP